MNNIRFNFNRVEIKKIEHNGYIEKHKIYPLGDTGAELHRFYNRAGVLYSAIYENGYEVMSCDNSYPEEEMSESKMLLAFLDYTILPELSEDSKEI